MNTTNSGRIRALFEKSGVKMAVKGLLASFLGMLVVACSGCGGGGGGSPATVQTSQTAPKVIAIDAEGDSTMVGAQVINGVQGKTANNPPALLQKALGANAKVINSAVGGARIPQALDGTPPRYVVPLASRLASLSPNIVLSNFGINDAEFGDENLYRTDLVTWISTVRNMGATPVLEEPNPVCDATHPKLDAFVGILRDVAAQQGVTLIAQYDYIKSLPNWQAMLSDCVHPLDSLYEIKAQREYNIIAPMVATFSK